MIPFTHCAFKLWSTDYQNSFGIMFCASINGQIFCALKEEALSCSHQSVSEMDSFFRLFFKLLTQSHSTSGHSTCGKSMSRQTKTCWLHAHSHSAVLHTHGHTLSSYRSCMKWRSWHMPTHTHTQRSEEEADEETSNPAKSIPQTLSPGGWPTWTLPHVDSSLFAKNPSQPLSLPTPIVADTLL